MVVPTFAPIMIGIALCMGIEPEATKATTSDVVVELLWIIAVLSNPIKSAVKGLDVAITIVAAAVLPKCCNEVTINSRANTKSSNVPKMYRDFRIESHKLLAGFTVGDDSTLNLF